MPKNMALCILKKGSIPVTEQGIIGIQLSLLKETNSMKDSREYSDSIVLEWGRIREGYFSSAVRDKAIELAGINSETIAADIGTGTGFMLEGIAPLVKKVIGVDNSPRMLSIAQSKLSKKLKSKIEFRFGEMDNLPFKDKEVNAVFANMALHHAVDSLRAIKEMSSVYSHGGVMVITDLDEHPHEWFRQDMADRWLGFQLQRMREWLPSAGFAVRSVIAAIRMSTGKRLAWIFFTPGA